MADNLQSTKLHPNVVSEKLRNKISVVGPFSSPPLVDLVISPLGVVPKKEPNKFHLIHHLSYSKGGSVNYAIDL